MMPINALGMHQISKWNLQELVNVAEPVPRE